MALYYNKDLFDEYGVGSPDGTWDHDDYLDVMKRFTRDRDGGGQTGLWGNMLTISWDRIQMHVNGWGGHFADPDDSTRCRRCEPETMAAKGYSVTAEIFANMADAKWIAYAAWDEIFTLGQASAEQMGNVCRQIQEAQEQAG